MEEFEEVLVPRVAFVASFFVFYCIAALAVRKIVEAPPKDISVRELHDYYGQHISLTHSTIAVCSAICIIVYEGGMNYHLPTLPRHTVVLAVSPNQNSLGYFCFDMLYAEVFSLHNTAMRLHHLCVLFGGFLLFFSPYGGPIANSNP